MPEAKRTASHWPGDPRAACGHTQPPASPRQGTPSSAPTQDLAKLTAYQHIFLFFYCGESTTPALPHSPHWGALPCFCPRPSTAWSPRTRAPEDQASVPADEHAPCPVSPATPLCLRAPDPSDPSAGRSTHTTPPGPPVLSRDAGRPPPCVCVTSSPFSRRQHAGDLCVLAGVSRAAVALGGQECLVDPILLAVGKCLEVGLQDRVAVLSGSLGSCHAVCSVP